MKLRSLFVAGAAALSLTGVFVPRANAALIRYYDFEGADTAPYPVNLQSHAPAVETGAGTTLTLKGTQPPGAPYPSGNTFDHGQIALNLAPGVVPPGGVSSLGTNHNKQTNLNVDIPFPSAVGIYDVTSVSFAYGANGNGYEFVQLQRSTDGGVTFTNIGVAVALPSTPGAVINILVPAGTTLNIPNLVLRLNFTGGQSNGNDDMFDLDNIQINGTIIPEPATVVGGLLGVLGLGWQQRKRLRLLLPRSRRA